MKNRVQIEAVQELIIELRGRSAVQEVTDK
jgi:hypothetical protein